MVILCYLCNILTLLKLIITITWLFSVNFLLLSVFFYCSDCNLFCLVLADDFYISKGVVFHIWSNFIRRLVLILRRRSRSHDRLTCVVRLDIVYRRSSVFHLSILLGVTTCLLSIVNRCIRCVLFFFLFINTRIFYNMLSKLLS